VFTTVVWCQSTETEQPWRHFWYDITCFKCVSIPHVVSGFRRATYTVQPNTMHYNAKVLDICRRTRQTNRRNVGANGKSAAVPRICRWDQPWSSWAGNGMPLSSRSLSTPIQLHSITNVSCTYSEAGTGLKDTAYRMKMYSAAQPPWTGASSLENMTTTCQAELLWTNHIHTNGHI